MLRGTCPSNNPHRGTGRHRAAPRMKDHQHREGTAVTKVLLVCRHSPWHGAAGVWRKQDPVLGTAESFVPVLCEVVPAS